MNWSPYQTAIFEAIARTSDSLLVSATAGSGKTTTIVEAIRHIPSTQRVIFLAFNKRIAESLQSRITSPNATCMTLHAVGNAAWRNMLAWDSNDCELDSRKTSTIVSDLLPWRERTEYGGNMVKLISLAKGAGIVPLLRDTNGATPIGAHGLIEDTDSAWEDLIDFYALDPEATSIPWGRRVLAESLRISRESIDYDDMLYLPVVCQSIFERYDVVFLDEAQDVNSIQVEIVTRMVKPGGRVIAVGDSHQAIYGFRGALSNSMDHIQRVFGARSLPLSISYRCPTSVVAHAQQWVSHIQPSDTAEAGLVETLVPNAEAGHWSATDFQPTDAILCRLNKPLASLAFKLIRLRVPCRIVGRDIGKGLTDLIQRMKASDLPDLCDRLEAYRTREIKRAKSKGRDSAAMIASLNDRIDTIYVFIDALSPDATTATTRDLVSSIESMFSDTITGMLTLSTVHKAKGLEWPRVFVLDAHEHMPSPWAKTDWQREQETNLQYVAATRAMRELRYIQSEGIR